MFADISTISAGIVTISAIVKVAVDLLILHAPTYVDTSKEKYTASLVLSIAIAVLTQVSLIDSGNVVLVYLGSVGAGALASLGANVTNDILKLIQSLKNIKTQGLDVAAITNLVADLKPISDPSQVTTDKTTVVTPDFTVSSQTKSEPAPVTQDTQPTESSDK
jgi:hypothetical protein